MTRLTLRRLSPKSFADEPEDVIPEKVGIQEHTARGRDDTSWIPGLALLARNDISPAIPQIIEVKHSENPPCGDLVLTPESHRVTHARASSVAAPTMSAMLAGRDADES